MRETIREEIRRALAKVDRPGTFCVSGGAPAILPGLEVEGLGPIGLPLTAGQAKALIERCRRAPHGQGERTVVDPSVRRVWRMEPGRFSLTNPDWDTFLAGVVDEVRDGLGLEDQRLEAHLHDLLLYEPGDFFLPHRDGEKLGRMVATLVVVLPSRFKGGELVVRHEGRERTVDFRGEDDNPFRIHYAAFYADCEHEVRPLRAGYRPCLVYNLTLARSKKQISAPRESEPIERIAEALRTWAEDDSGGKLAVTLEHRYTRDGLAWDALKGVDRARARVLLEAAHRAGCAAHLAVLTLYEAGSGEYADDEYGYGYGSRHRSRRDEDDADEEDDESDSEYVMDEVFDVRLTAALWSDREGHTLPIGELDVGEDEVLDPEALRGVKPEEEFEGYTGNEGMTLERWYRHAAIVIWPERRHFEVLCERDSREAVPLLGQMVARWRRARGKDATALKAQCLDLAAAILAKWPADRFASTGREEPKGDGLLETLAALGEPRLIGLYLRDVMTRDAGVDPSGSLAATCRKFGWERFREELRAVMQGTTRDTTERNVRLLEELCTAGPRTKTEGWAGLVRDLAGELISAIEAIDGGRSSTDWRSRAVDRAQVLAGLARSLLLTGQDELLGRLVAHALDSPKKYPLTEAHLKALEALRPWLKKHVKSSSPALSRWLASCRERLEARTARAPREPGDFRRAAKISCGCPDCKELKRFLADPRESVYRLRARQDRREHLEGMIREYRCDLDRKTERVGSPHTLVCTKNTASYQEELRTYQRDREHLATVRAIEADLSR